MILDIHGVWWIPYYLIIFLAGMGARSVWDTLTDS